MSNHEPSDAHPTDDGALTLEPDHGPSGSAGSSRGALPWIAVAAVFVVILVAIGVVVAQRSSDDEAEPEPLPLVGGSQAETDTAAAMIAPAADIEYRLEGELPDLGSDAPVYRVTRPDLDEARVAALAKGLGVEGEVLSQANTWEVSGDGGVVALYPANSAWAVSYSPIAGPSAGSSDSSSSGGAIEPATVPSSQPVTTVPPDQPMDQEVVVEVEDPAADLQPTALPSELEAESIARKLLEAAGVLSDAAWEVEVTESGMAGIAVSCAAGEPCPEVGQTEEFVTSRGVTFHRVVDGVATTGLDWYVDVGDEGAIGSVNGTIATLEKVADYPLRSTQSVYDDMVAGKGFQPGPVPMLGAEVQTFDEVGEAMDGVEKQAVGEAECDPEGNARDCSTTTTVCPGSPLCEGAQTPVPPDPDTTCTTNPNGVEIDCSSPPNTGSGVPDADVCVEVQEDGTTLPCDVPDTVPSFVPPEPATIVITITNAELGAQVIPAVVDGAEAAYLVPTYVFIGTYDDGTEFSTELVAIDSSLIAPPDEPETIPPETVIVPPDSAIGSPPDTVVPATALDEPGTAPASGGGRNPDDGAGSTGVTAAEAGG
jgi:hypothetical protein